MPHIPRRFRPLQTPIPDTGRLAPSQSPPPDLLDVYEDLPLPAEPPRNKSEVPRNPVVRNERARPPGLQRLSIRRHAVPPADVEYALFADL